jgi:hypothetical protein
LALIDLVIRARSVTGCSGSNHTRMMRTPATVGGVPVRLEAVTRAR